MAFPTELAPHVEALAADGDAAALTAALAAISTDAAVTAYPQDTGALDELAARLAPLVMHPDAGVAIGAAAATAALARANGGPAPPLATSRFVWDALGRPAMTDGTNIRLVHI